MELRHLKSRYYARNYIEARNYIDSQNICVFAFLLNQKVFPKYIGGFDNKYYDP